MHIKFIIKATECKPVIKVTISLTMICIGAVSIPVFNHVK